MEHPLFQLSVWTAFYVIPRAVCLKPSPCPRVLYFLLVGGVVIPLADRAAEDLPQSQLLLPITNFKHKNVTALKVHSAEGGELDLSQSVSKAPRCSDA